MKTLSWPNKPNTDLFGIPLQLGDTVLTNRYGSAALGIVTKVVKLTKSCTYVNVESHHWDRKTKQYVTAIRSIRKYPYQLIRIQPLIDYNTETYPESLL